MQRYEYGKVLTEDSREYTSYQHPTAVCNAEAANVIPSPMEPKFPAKIFSNAMHSNPNGAAVVGLDSSSLTTGNAIMILPTRKLLNMNAIVLQR